VVFLTGLEAGLLPLRFGGSAGPPVEEERRLLFVGMTRARSHLYLTWARRRAVRGMVRESERSPFVDDIEAALLAETCTPPRPVRPARTPPGRQLELL
jgi:DNA helicase-2/ATP-dependent DNA helicase PcrA